MPNDNRDKQDAPPIDLATEGLKLLGYIAMAVVGGWLLYTNIIKFLDRKQLGVLGRSAGTYTGVYREGNADSRKGTLRILRKGESDIVAVLDAAGDKTCAVDFRHRIGVGSEAKDRWLSDDENWTECKSASVNFGSGEVVFDGSSVNLHVTAGFNRREIAAVPRNERTMFGNQHGWQYDTLTWDFVGNKVTESGAGQD